MRAGAERFIRSEIQPWHCRASDEMTLLAESSFQMQTAESHPAAGWWEEMVPGGWWQKTYPAHLWSSAWANLLYNNKKKDFCLNLKMFFGYNNSKKSTPAHTVFILVFLWVWGHDKESQRFTLTLITDPKLLVKLSLCQVLHHRLFSTCHKIYWVSSLHLLWQTHTPYKLVWSLLCARSFGVFDIFFLLSHICFKPLIY